MKWKSREIVEDHLLYKEFPQNNVIWDLHGERPQMEDDSQ